MAVARPLLGLTAIILLAGGIVLQFLVILSGLQNSPENRIYFIQGSTQGFTNTDYSIPNPARWTYLSICGVVDGKNGNCGARHAAIPFNIQDNFGPNVNAPASLLNANLYYLSRVSWAFYLIALFFAVVAIFLSLLALCTRLGAYLTGFTALIATVMQAVAASLMTAWTVKAVRAFSAGGLNATLGVYAYAFTWTAFACFLLSSLLFCCGGAVTGGSSSSGTKSSYFGRKRSTRSRGSFIDSESGRRVKDEYE